MGFKADVERLLNPKKISLTVVVTNLLGRRCSNVNVNLIRVDDSFYHDAKKFKGKTGENGEYTEAVLEGGYLIEVSKGRMVLQELHEVWCDGRIEIKLPSVFGWRRRKLTLDWKQVRDFYEIHRSDKNFCFKCKHAYRSLGEIFECKYCGRYFCVEHRLPEAHDCPERDLLKAPPAEYRKIFSGGKTIITH
jgi:hypothetical protein